MTSLLNMAIIIIIIIIQQFKTYLKVNNQVIPSVKLNETFTYLRKTFSYTMSIQGKIRVNTRF